MANRSSCICILISGEEKNRIRHLQMPQEAGCPNRTFSKATPQFIHCIIYVMMAGKR